jgi:hypothetical protein
MTKDVVEVKPLAGFHLHVRFEDGVEGKIDLKDLVRFEGVFAALRNAKISGKPIRIAVPEGRPA